MHKIIHSVSFLVLLAALALSVGAQKADKPSAGQQMTVNSVWRGEVNHRYRERFTSRMVVTESEGESGGGGLWSRRHG